MKSESVSHSVVSDSLQAHGLRSARLLCPWDFPGKNIGVGGHSLSPGDLPDPGTEPNLLHQQEDSLPSESPGKLNRCIILEAHLCLLF